MPKYRHISKKSSRRLTREVHNTLSFRLAAFRFSLQRGFGALGMAMEKAADSLRVAITLMIKTDVPDRQGECISEQALQQYIEKNAQENEQPITGWIAPNRFIIGVDPADPKGDSTGYVPYWYEPSPSKLMYHEGRDL